MMLKIHLNGAEPYEIGPEIWEQPLADAIRAEAETIAADAGSDLLESPGQKHRDQLRDRIIAEMTEALRQTGDTYTAPDRVRYSLIESPARDVADKGTLPHVSQSDPVVEEVLRFEDLPLGSSGSRRAVVRWTDGSEGEGLTWFADEILVSEGDHGTSRLMFPRAEMHRAAGSVRAPRGP